MDEALREELFVIARDSTILLFKDLHKTLSKISNEDAGILMKAIFAHVNGEAPDLGDSVVAGALYPIVEDQVDRMEQYRSKQAAKRNKREQNGTNMEQNGTNAEQNGSPYPYPSPYPNNNISRSARVQRSMGFSTERKDVNYDELAKQNYWREE